MSSLIIINILIFFCLFSKCSERTPKSIYLVSFGNRWSAVIVCGPLWPLAIVPIVADSPRQMNYVHSLVGYISFWKFTGIIVPASNCGVYKVLHSLVYFSRFCWCRRFRLVLTLCTCTWQFSRVCLFGFSTVPCSQPPQRPTTHHSLMTNIIQTYPSIQHRTHLKYLIPRKSRRVFTWNIRDTWRRAKHVCSYTTTVSASPQKPWLTSIKNYNHFNPILEWNYPD